jgi:hypothetical protein
MQQMAVMSSGGFEGVADVGPYWVQWQVRQRPVPACSTVPELLPQCPAWDCTAGAAATLLTVAGMVPRRPNAST